MQYRPYALLYLLFVSSEVTQYWRRNCKVLYNIR